MNEDTSKENIPIRRKARSYKNRKFSQWSINRKEIKTEEDNEIKIVQESLFKLLNLLLLNYLSLHHCNLLCIKSSHS